MKYGIELSPKEGRCEYKGLNLRYFNQANAEWTHPYVYDDPKSTLHSAGCGIFSMAVVIQKLSGIEVDLGELADYSCACGGRGDDGTDRPELLAGLVRGGYDEKYGFRYNGDGLVNDHEQLWRVLTQGGCAMCNLRVGHIVAVIDWREVDGERQMLVVDSACESADRRIYENVREVIPGTEVKKLVRNSAGVECGLSVCHAMYWVPVSMAVDFNLIWKR